MTMKATDTALIPPHVMARAVGEEIVILDLNSSTYFGLDPVGARAWQLLAEKRTLGEICDVMLHEFEVARPDLERDLRDLANELQLQGLIRIVKDNEGHGGGDEGPVAPEAP